MTEDYDKLKLGEIAERINAHLKRFEADTEGVNAPRYYESSRTGKRERAAATYYSAGAYRAGSRVKIRYVSFQGSSTLTKAEAITYLRHLDEGGTEKHYALKHEGRL